MVPMQEWGGGEIDSGAAGIQMAASGGWRTIMQGLDELTISSVGLEPVLGAIELVGQESVASGRFPDTTLLPATHLSAHSF